MSSSSWWPAIAPSSTRIGDTNINDGVGWIVNEAKLGALLYFPLVGAALTSCLGDMYHRNHTLHREPNLARALLAECPVQDPDEVWIVFAYTPPPAIEPPRLRSPDLRVHGVAAAGGGGTGPHGGGDGDRVPRGDPGLYEHRLPEFLGVFLRFLFRGFDQWEWDVGDIGGGGAVAGGWYGGGGGKER